MNVPVDFQYNTSLAGKYLIVIIDPEMLTYDRNMTDTIVTVLLEPYRVSGASGLRARVRSAGDGCGGRIHKNRITRCRTSR